MTADVNDEPDQRELTEHTVLGRYRLVQRLGEGGMGVVHLALDRHGRAVALKVLRPHVAHDPDARQRLAREVDTLSRIRSPRVAPVIDADVDGPRPFIVTRYVPGDPLDEVVGRTGPMGAADLHRLGDGLAEALDVIHGSGVIHRDLKPGNVLMVDGDPVVIDFGIAHVADDVRLTMTGLVMGTPGYLAPELIEGGAVSPATDWWGWAATLTFAASGRAPFGRGPMDAVLARVTRGEPDLTSVDPRIAPLLYAALSPRAAERPHQREVVTALERYAHGGLVTDVIELRRPPAEPVAPTEPVAAGRTSALSAPAPRAAPVDPPARPLLAPAVGPAAYPPPGPGGQPGPLPDGQPAAPPGQDPGFPAGWADQERFTDPRIGRASRSGTLAALLVLLVAGAAVAPVVAGAVFLLAMVVARTVDRSVTSLVMRRHERGPRSSDVPIAVAAGPWHLVVGVLGAAFSAVMPALVAVSAVFVCALGIRMATGASVDPGSMVPLAVGGLLGVLMAWWGPGGAGLRRGTRSLVRGLTRGTTGRAVVVAVCLLGALALVLWGLRAGRPLWWPLDTPPTQLITSSLVG